MSVQPVTLEGRHVRLEPLSLAHHADLCEAGLDEELWRWIPGQVMTVLRMRTYGSPECRVVFAVCANCDRGQRYCSPSRSEEHTSELQSLRHLVCRLLLEKKK